MVIEVNYKKPGDLIRSEEWNKILDELVELRRYVDNMTRSVTLTDLSSPVGASYSLSSGVTDDFNYGIDVMGLITKQYYVGRKEQGDICRFGVTDFADVLSYWSGAANGDRDALEVQLEYVDGSVYKTDKLFIHEWSNLRPKGNKNPYAEYLQSPSQRLWYRYTLVNPNPDKEIRYITFRDADPECAVRIANVLHYMTRVRPLIRK
ncbi:MAG TPA: hypothetical protein VMC84_04520 [Methanocella sp.]|uniref:hypothetical protein n=1 Tax=Methanocella sp. TaxID=2052833 RepID=UPI002B902CC2|nr:hypothetical protein [Methanocella sp.]HTY90420.1 hypothetical protein [Methanocella sp.]